MLLLLVLCYCLAGLSAVTVYDMEMALNRLFSAENLHGDFIFRLAHWKAAAEIPISRHLENFFFYAETLKDLSAVKFEAYWQYIRERDDFLCLEAAEIHDRLQELLLLDVKSPEALEIFEDLLKASAGRLSPAQQARLYELISSQCQEATIEQYFYFIRVLVIMLKYYDAPVIKENVLQQSTVDFSTLSYGSNVGGVLILQLAPAFKALFTENCSRREIRALMSQAFTLKSGKRAKIGCFQHYSVLNAVFQALFCQLQHRKLLDSTSKAITAFILRCFSLDQMSRVLYSVIEAQYSAIVDAIFLAHFHAGLESPVSFEELLKKANSRSSIALMAIYLCYYDQEPTSIEADPHVKALLLGARLISPERMTHFEPSNALLDALSHLPGATERPVLYELAKVFLSRQLQSPYSCFPYRNLSKYETITWHDMMQFINMYMNFYEKRQYSIPEPSTSTEPFKGDDDPVKCRYIQENYAKDSVNPVQEDCLGSFLANLLTDTPTWCVTS